MHELTPGFGEQQPHESKFKLLTAPEFVEEATTLFHGAHQRVGLKSMTFIIDDTTTEMVNGMWAAAIKGVPADLYFDYESFLSTGRAVQLDPRKKGFDRERYSRHKANYEAVLRPFAQAGGKIHITNSPRTGLGFVTPFTKMGRDHRKGAWADDTSYFGKVNMNERNFGSIDYMLRIGDPTITDAVVELLQGDGDTPSIDTNGIRLLQDKGTKGRSIIYDYALALINKSQESLQLTTQLPPSGRLLEAAIAAAKRGVEVEMITSPQTSNYIEGKGYKQIFGFAQWRTKKVPNFTMLHANNTLHAGLFIVDGCNGTAAIGSSNFSEPGVWFGTKEIELFSKRSDIVRPIHEAYTSIREHANPVKSRD